MRNFLFTAITYTLDYYGPDKFYGCQCDADDSCRCSYYEGLCIDNINLNRVLSDLVGNRVTITQDFYDFAVSLGLDSAEAYEIKRVHGYYGEEVESIHLVDEVRIMATLQRWIHENSVLVNLDQIPEYLESKGHDCSQDRTVNEAVRNSLLKENNASQEPQYVAKTSQAFVKTLALRNVVVPNQRHYESVEARKMEGNGPLIVGVVVQSGDVYRLVDGYHRYKGAQGKSGKFIVLS